jgi:hypothetical protein
MANKPYNRIIDAVPQFVKKTNTRQLNLYLSLQIGYFGLVRAISAEEAYGKVDY